MSNTNEQLKRTISEIRTDLSTLDLKEQQNLIRIGSALEEFTSGLPEWAGNVAEALSLSLQGLQVIYLGQVNDVPRLTQALQSALVAAEQIFAAQDNPLSIAMLERAKQSLITALPSAEQEPSLTATSEPASIPPPEPLPAPSLPPSLDDVAALLIEVDHNDSAGLARVHAMLVQVRQDEAIPSHVQEYLSSALQLAFALAQGKSENAEQQFAALGQLIETALNAAFNPPPEAFAAPVSVMPVEKSAPVIPPVAEPEPVTQAQTSAPALAEESDLPADADMQLLGEFIVESNEYIQGAEAALLALETDSDNLEAVNVIFRAFHTIKGTAAFLGLQDVMELAHLAESLLSRIRDREIRCVGGYADLSLRSIDTLKELLQNVQRALGGGKVARPSHYHELVRILTNPEAAGVSEQLQNPQPVEVESETPAAVVAELNQKVAALNSNAKPARQNGNEASAEASVRVRTDRLDKLMDIIGELVIANSMTAQDETIVKGNYHELTRKVTHVGKIVRELQDLSTAMRMVPLKATFQKMARLVRDVAQKSGKQIEFVYEGEDTEIDRHMVDVINDPLVHMLRNAVDHGIESPEARIANGKSRTGHVRLTAYNAGGNVVVELQDDGQGLNRQRILEKALSKELIESDKGLSDSEIYNLIFAPGFSTNDQVTDLSGRGVGMDVVKRNVESLRGRIGISSVSGKGCTFSIQLPLTLAITDGMLIRIGTESYIIPTANIHLSFRPTVESISTITGRGEMVMLRGELLPIFRLHRLLEVPNAEQDPTKALLVIVADGRRRCALLVDELLGQQQLVVKSLGDGIGKIQGVSGGAILGDGRVGLILDCAEIVALVRQNTSAVDRKMLVTQVAA